MMYFVCNTVNHTVCSQQSQYMIDNIDQYIVTKVIGQYIYCLLGQIDRDIKISNCIDQDKSRELNYYWHWIAI